ncbi:hypothetical protein DLAC_01052 [Tieghemostelium lacteum]|uniref:Uncharacterized protein n=1 Tax=Tieghemostelium lacteum TaxID=361077 RepID=A0A152A7M4_TIELA|nr:hypothetical protein DLAC_01052 [Tieghemostelium lacteum]|eukprot:KYR02232.1 hypothetical protein DLAC_01052 [Tieghemostelium lacteum]
MQSNQFYNNLNNFNNLQHPNNNDYQLIFDAFIKWISEDYSNLEILKEVYNNIEPKNNYLFIPTILQWVEDNNQSKHNLNIKIDIFLLLHPKENHMFQVKMYDWITDYLIEKKDNVMKFIKYNYAISSLSTLMIYKHGLFVELLQSENYKVIEVLFGGNFQLNLHIEHPHLLPLSMIIRSLKLILRFQNEIEDPNKIIKNMVEVGYSLVKKHWSISDKYNVKMHRCVLGDEKQQSILPSKLKLNWVKEAISLVVLGDRNSKNVFIDCLIKILCFKTLGNLTEQEIQLLIDDYLLLIPIILKYMDYKISYKTENYKGKPNHIVVTLMDEFNSISSYFDRKLINHRCELIFQNIKQQLEILPNKHNNNNNNLVFHIGLINSIISSPIIRENIQTIYKYLISFVNFKSNDNPNIIVLLSNLITLHGNLSIEHQQTLFKEVVNIYLKNLNDKEFNYPRHKYPMNLLVQILISDTHFAISNLDELLSCFFSISFPTYTIFLNQICCQSFIWKLLKSNDNYTKFHSKIIEVSNNSIINRIYLLEYLMKTESNSNLNEMITQITDNIDNVQITDDHFHITLLRYHQYFKLQLYNPPLSNDNNNNIDKLQLFKLFSKTITSYLKCLQSMSFDTTLNQEMLVKFINTEEEIDIFFQLVPSSLQNSAIISKIIQIFLDEKSVNNIDKYVIEFLNNYIRVPKTITISIANNFIDILNRITLYLHIDEQIELLLKCIVPENLQFILKRDSFPKLFKNLSNPIKVYSHFIESIDANGGLSKHRETNRLVTANIISSLSGENLIDFHHHLSSVLIDKLLHFVKIPFSDILEAIRYFKPLKSLSPLLYSKVLKLFMATKTDKQKEILLTIIRYEGITVLEFLNNQRLTGFHYIHQLGIDYEKTLVNVPYAPDCIINDILGYSVIESLTISEICSPSMLLNYALVSKVFFKETCKILKNFHVNQFSSNWSAISCSQWSLFHMGLYHLDYKYISLFRLDSSETIFYQLFSLSINSDDYLDNFDYLVDREMVNLSTLTLKYSEPYYNSIIALLENCHRLEKVFLSVKPNYHQVPSETIQKNLSQLLYTLFKNNYNSLELFRFEFKFDEYFGKIAPLLKLMHKLPKVIPQTNSNQVNILCNIDSRSIINSTLGESWETNAKYITTLNLRLNQSHIDRYWTRDAFLQPTLFKRLKKLNIRSDGTIYVYNLIRFPSLKIKKLYLQFSSYTNYGEDFHKLCESICQLSLIEQITIDCWDINGEELQILLDYLNKISTLKMINLYKEFELDIMSSVNTGVYQSVTCKKQQNKFKFIRVNK